MCIRDSLYSERIGWDRARGMNHFGTMCGHGLSVGAGSDSTVTPLDPFLQMKALRAHHVAEESVAADVALALHTVGSARLAAGEQRRGTIAPGAPADLAWLDRDPVTTDADDLESTEVLGTWASGTRVWPPADAETE